MTVNTFWKRALLFADPPLNLLNAFFSLRRPGFILKMQVNTEFTLILRPNLIEFHIYHLHLQLLGCIVGVLGPSKISGYIRIGTNLIDPSG